MSNLTKYDDDFDVESLDVDDVLVVDQPNTFSTPSTISNATLDANLSDDPFAPQDGKTLLWRGFNMTLVSTHRRHPFEGPFGVFVCFL